MPSVNHTIVRSNHTQSRGRYFVTGQRAKIVRERMDGVRINDGVKKIFTTKKNITTDVLQSCGIPMMMLVTSNELASTASERCSFTPRHDRCCASWSTTIKSSPFRTNVFTSFFFCLN